jgi:endonuclease G
MALVDKKLHYTTTRKEINMLKDLQCHAMQVRFSERRSQRSSKLSSLDALMQGHDVDPEMIEPLNRQLERAVLLNRSDLASGITGNPSGSRKVFEAVINSDDSLPRQFFENGEKAGNAVCRVIGLDLNYNQSYGTAFCIGPGIILTNNHVIANAEIAAVSEVEFGFWPGFNGGSGSVRVKLNPDELFFTDLDLDFTLVAIDSSVAAEIFRIFGTIELIPSSGKALLGEVMNIIHHGNGGPQTVALRNNTVVDVFDDFIHYTTDTLPGASGAPVLNDHWQLVALHHASTEETGNDGNKFIVNEGIRISSICARIKEATQ